MSGKGAGGKPTDDLDVHREPLSKPLKLIGVVGEIALITLIRRALCDAGWIMDFPLKFGGVRPQHYSNHERLVSLETTRTGRRPDCLQP